MRFRSVVSSPVESAKNARSRVNLPNQIGIPSGQTLPNLCILSANIVLMNELNKIGASWPIQTDQNGLSNSGHTRDRSELNPQEARGHAFRNARR